jgi:hypothetical protein
MKTIKPSKREIKLIFNFQTSHRNVKYKSCFMTNKTIFVKCFNYDDMIFSSITNFEFFDFRLNTKKATYTISLQNYNSYKYYLSVLNKDYKQGKSLEEIAKKINKTPEEIKTILSIFN